MLAEKSKRRASPPARPEGFSSYASRTPRSVGQQVPPWSKTPGFVPTRRTSQGDAHRRGQTGYRGKTDIAYLSSIFVSK